MIWPDTPVKLTAAFVPGLIGFRNHQQVNVAAIRGCSARMRAEKNDPFGLGGLADVARDFFDFTLCDHMIKLRMDGVMQ